MSFKVGNDYSKLSEWDRECKLNEILFKTKPKVLTEKEARNQYSAFYNTILDKVKILWTIHQIQLEKVFQKMPTKVERGIRLATAGLGVIGAVLPPVLALAHLAHMAFEITHLVAKAAKEGIELAHQVKEALEEHEPNMQLTSESILHEICFRLTLRYRGEIRGFDIQKCHEFALVKAYQVIDRLKTCDIKFGADCTQEKAIELIMDKVDPDPIQNAFQILSEVLAKHNNESSSKEEFKDRFTFLTLATLKEFGSEKDGIRRSLSPLMAYGAFVSSIGKLAIKHSGKFRALEDVFPYQSEFECWDFFHSKIYESTDFYSLPFRVVSFSSNSWAKEFSSLAVVINRLMLHKLMLQSAGAEDQKMLSDRKFLQKIATPSHLSFFLKMIQNLAKIARFQKKQIQDLVKITRFQKKQIEELNDRMDKLEGLVVPVNINGIHPNLQNRNAVGNPVNIARVPQNPQNIPVIHNMANNEQKTKEFMDQIRKLNAVDQIKALMKAVPWKGESDLSVALMKEVDEESFFSKLKGASREYLRNRQWLKYGFDSWGRQHVYHFETERSELRSKISSFVSHSRSLSWEMIEEDYRK